MVIVKELKKPIELYVKPAFKSMDFKTNDEQKLGISIVKNHLLLLHGHVSNERFKELILNHSFINRIIDSIRETINTI